MEANPEEVKLRITLSIAGVLIFVFVVHEFYKQRPNLKNPHR